jgi:DNA-binding IclR family transcriptional regulator
MAVRFGIVPHTNGRGPRSPVARAFRVLSWMAAGEGDSWGLGEIAKGVAMHPSTCHRILGVLEAEGLVQQESENGRYCLGLEFWQLAWTAGRRRTLADIALPHLRWLTEETGETTWLGVYDYQSKDMMWVATVDSPRPIRFVQPLYQRLPVHAGAIGRAILAFLPEVERQAVLNRPLARRTAKTVTESRRLESVLEEVRNQGYAISVGEQFEGGVGVAAPVLSHDGGLLGAIGIGLPMQRFKPSDEKRLAQLAIACAKEVAQSAGRV